MPPSVLEVGTGPVLNVWAWNQVGREAREGWAQCCRGGWCKSCGLRGGFPPVGSIAGWQQARGDFGAELAQVLPTIF